MTNFFVELLSRDRAEQYDAAIADFPAANIYHTRGWMRLLAEVLEVEPKTLVAIEDDAIVGILPLAAQRRLFGGQQLGSLPFSHHVPALGRAEVVVRLYAEAVAMARANNRSFFVRDRAPIDGGEHFAPYVTTVVPIPATEEQLAAQVRSTTKRQLRQALRNESLVLKVAQSTDDFDAMDFIMASNRRELGSATYPPAFFRKAHEILGDNLLSEICYLDGKPIGMLVSSHYGENAIWHYGASVPGLRNVRPNNLTYWSAFKWALGRGAKRVDIGTSLPSQEGLIFFKESWGGHTTPLTYTRFHAGAGIAQDGLAVAIVGEVLKRTPLPIFRTVTPFLLKRLG